MSNKECEFCDGTGVIVKNAGMCGGCEVCGDKEEKQTPCTCTLDKEVI